MKSNITISMDSDLKKEAEELFADLGMDIKTAFNIFVRQAVRDQKFPFYVRRFHTHRPNDTTLAALEEGRRLARDPNAKTFTTMEELIKDLNS